jgi:MFS transporter, DHA1 family, staphyloferrin B biosynthesis exporter
VTVPTTTRAGQALRALFLIQLVSMGAMEMTAPFWPLHFRQLGQLSPTALAWASSIAYAGPMVTAMLLAPLWGRWGDRIGHKPMLLRALVALALTQLWIGYSNDTAVILLARLVQGGLAGFIAAAQAYGGSLVGKAERGALMARLQVATAVGSILGPVLGGWVYDAFDFRTVNLSAAAICAVCASAAWLSLPPVAARPKQPTSPVAARPASVLTPVLGLLLAIVLVQASKMMPQAFFGVYAEQVLRTPAWLTGLCYGATALGLCISAPLWARRFALREEGKVLYEVELVCWASVVIVAVQALSVNVPVFVMTRILWGVCLGALLPVLYGLLSNRADTACQGEVLGAGNSAAKAGALLGIGIGALALGQLPIRHVFWPLVASYMIAAVTLRILRRRTADATLPVPS